MKLCRFITLAEGFLMRNATITKSHSTDSVFRSPTVSRRRSIQATVFIALLLVGACNQGGPEAPENAIRIGAILPFSGEQAALGINIEQALSLAVEDVNKGGGVDGKPLVLISRDSNSGSDKGYEQAKQLLYDEGVKYLIGPEENNLAKALVSDVKKKDILNILPGIAAPIIRETGNRGAWIRLAPSPSNVGCAMGIKALQEGLETAALIVSSDDYQMGLASAFNSAFGRAGGISLGAMTIDPGQDSYLDEIAAIRALKADVVLLLAYPKTAAVIMQEWLVTGQTANWYLAPTLHTDMFLQNVPSGALENANVFSPSLSQPSECEVHDESDPRVMDCVQDNAKSFSDYYADRWRGDQPLPSSLFYYDAVVLLAMGLETAAATSNDSPSPIELRDLIQQNAETPGTLVRWSKLDTALKKAANGEDLAYIGAASEYEFNNDGQINLGETDHSVMDTWTVKGNAFILSDSVGLNCARGGGI